MTFSPPGVDAALEAPKAALKDGGWSLPETAALLTRAVPITCVLAKTSSLIIYSFVILGCVTADGDATAKGCRLVEILSIILTGYLSFFEYCKVFKVFVNIFLCISIFYLSFLVE